jgi:16S rRNA (cytosine967-C5)-methyltransferase
MASAALRHLGRIDAVLARFMNRPLEAGAETPRAILRTGAAQILALNTAPHAAVSAAVDLANSARSAQPFAKLINAVLRKVAGEGKDHFASLPAGANLPDWLFTRWRAAYGDETAEAIAKALSAEPPLDLRAKPSASLPPEARPGPFGAGRLDAGADVTALEGFADGAWWVQDAAAGLPAMLLGDVAGKSVLDLCAAPGGKTMQLAAAGARVTAVDWDETRLARVRANLERTKLHAEIVAADILAWTPPALADAVLLDAPCTATGTLRRRPDVAWLRRPSDIEALAERQKQLLARAATFLKPGGVLVYAVCSLEPEEGDSVALHAPPELIPEPMASTDGLETHVTPQGWLRTLPSSRAADGGMDGFFAARFRKA